MSASITDHEKTHSTGTTHNSILRTTRAEVDLSKIGHNLSIVRKLVSPNVKIMGVVKANAYSHGITEVAHYLQSSNIDMLGVAFTNEAITLRRAGITTPILVFYGTSKEEFSLVTKYDLVMTLTSFKMMENLHDYLNASGTRVQVHVKIDTGMGRIGVQYNEAPQLIEKVLRQPNIDLDGVYSHLATSDGSDPEYLRLQLERFDTVLTDINKLGVEINNVHIANSGGIMSAPDSHFNMVRPGIMLYGYSPGEYMPDTIHLKPALSLKSSIGFVKEVDKGVSISYGRRYATEKAARIGTIPIGYADGYNRLLTNKGEALIHGRRYPVVGTVCMDQIMVDLGLDTTISVGDEVTLMGSDGNEAINGWDIARHIGTIPYEILCAISARVPRIYLNNSEHL